MTSLGHSAAPGRLGCPTMSLADDPRADPRMLAAMAPFGMAAAAGPSPVDADSSLDEVLAFCAQNEAGFRMVVEALAADLPPVPGVVRQVQHLTRDDGSTIALHVHEPSDRSDPLPAILHLHGGAMAMFEAAWPNYQRWRDALAAGGTVVIGVEFRNAAGGQGPHPFPAGLDDCLAALRWVHAERESLGISHVVVSGESGGGNLALATALRAKREGLLDAVAGVYAQCPYISNAYADPPAELASLRENDGYFLGCEQLSGLALAYDPTGAHGEDPLAWPLHAAEADLVGLPPHMIVVNELDPLRDEGLAHYRALLHAGVDASSRTVNGTCHSGDCLFEAALPDVWSASVADIVAFAARLAPPR